MGCTQATPIVRVAKNDSDLIKLYLDMGAMGKELKDLNLGIVGFGASGQELARRAKAFGMRIMAIDIPPAGGPHVPLKMLIELPEG